MTVEVGFIIFFGIWLIAISVVLIWIFVSIRSLIKEAEGKNVVSLLNKTLAKLRINEKEIILINKDLSKVKELDKVHLQKVGLVRFNPFSETGGDHSFSLAMLDANDDGVVLTGLHTRERTRLYIKAIKGSKSVYELSKEEQDAIGRAKKVK